MNWIGDIPLLNSNNIDLYGYPFYNTRSVVSTSENEWMWKQLDADGLASYIRNKSRYL